MKKYLSILLLLVACLPGHAQVNQYQYNDTEIKTGTYAYESIRFGDRIIVAGQSFVTHMNQPALVCLDADGNTIWDSAETDTADYPANSRMRNVIAGNDGYLYSYGIRNAVPTLWKVDPADGAILWKNTLTGYNSYEPSSMRDYDSSRFLIVYTMNNGGGYDEVRFSFVSKTTGAVLSTYPMGSYPNLWSYSVTIDADKNIYYGRADSLFARSAADPSVFLWRKKHASTFVDSYRMVHYDIPSSNLYFFGPSTQGGSRIVQVNPTDGELINTFSGTFGGGVFEDMKVHGSDLFMVWSHEYVGGSGSYTWTMKFDMAAGGWSWSSYADLTPNFSESANALAVDDDGNVFLTGYDLDGNYGPGRWTILKLDGATGDTLYTRVIDGEHAGDDDNSEGTGVAIINGVPCFVGNMQADYGYESKMAFVQIDPATGEVLIEKTIGGEYAFESKTLAIEPYGTDKTLVLKQVGRKLQLELYDSLKHILWTQHFEDDYYLLGGQLKASPNGKIYLSAQKRSKTLFAPFYDEGFYNTLFIYELNGSGALLETYSFQSSSFPVIPLEIHTENAAATVFYHFNNNVYYRRIVSQTLSQEYGTGMTYQETGAPGSYYWDHSATKGYWFFNLGGYNSVIELDKNTNAWTPQVTYPAAFSRVNHVEPVDANRAVLCGKTVSANEIVAVFDAVTMDTVWTRQLSTNNTSQVVRCLIDPQHQFIYTIASNNQDISVRKLSVATGAEMWSYAYNGSASLADVPVTIAYDGYRDQLIVAGYETDAAGQAMPVSVVLDTAGALVSAINLQNEVPGNGKAVCSHVLPDGSQWVGGNRNSLAMGPTGFITEIDSAIAVPCVPVPIVLASVFAMPSDADSCNGAAAISITGFPDFILDFNNGELTASSDGYSLLTDLCPGIHSVLITDGCTDSLFTQLIIPVDSNYVYNNPFIDSTVVDSLSLISENCLIYYNSIDTAFIDSVFLTANTVSVIWNIVDSNGPSVDTVTYELNNGNGVYVLQLSIFCPVKSMGDYFTVTQAIYYEDGVVFLEPVSTAGIHETGLTDCVIFPNPTNGSATIRFSSETAMLRVTDIQGKTILQGPIANNHVVSLGQLPAGVYLFEINTGQRTVVKRVIKQ